MSSLAVRPASGGIALAALLISTLSAQTTGGAHANALVGEWRGDAGTSAGVTLNLYANGTYARKVVGAIHYGWTLEGDVLLLAPLVADTGSMPTYGKASAVRLRMHGDSMVASSGDKSLSMKRVTWPVNESAILGRWEGWSDANERVTQDFGADGRLIVTVTLEKEAGRYTVRGNAITWEQQIPIPQRRRTAYKLDEGKLIIYPGRIGAAPIELIRTSPPQ